MEQLNILLLLISISGLGAVQLLMSCNDGRRVSLESEQPCNSSVSRFPQNGDKDVRMVIKRVDYHYKRGELYFSSGKYIYRTWLFKENVKNDSFKIHTEEYIVDLAVDWVNDNLYWTTRNHNVNMATLDGSNRRVIHTLDGEYRLWNIVVDPLERLIFWTSCTYFCNVFSSGLDGLKKETLRLNRRVYVRSMTIDVNKKKLYLLNVSIGSLLSCNYDGSEVKSVLKSRTWTNPDTSITYYFNKLYLLKFPQVISSLEIATKHMSVFYNISSSCHDHSMIAIHSSLQPYRTQHCEDKGCSHQCIKSSEGTDSCTCPMGLVLGSDEMTCLKEVKTNINMNKTIFPIDSNISIPCDVDGYPVPKIVWVKDNNTLQNNDKFVISEDSRLTVVRASVSDGGTYKCEAANQFSSSNSFVRISIYVPANTHIRMEKTTFLSGGNISIPCDVEGYPVPKVDWFKDNHLLQYNSKFVITENSILTVMSASVSDAGTYTCNASNQLSSSKSSVSIIIQEMNSFASGNRPNENKDGCVLPAERENRNCCTFQCPDCERGACSFAPGSIVTDVVIKVQCDPGYRSSDNLDKTTMVCINGTWNQEFPQCLRLCPPLRSESVYPRCFYGSFQVDCNLPMLPDTSATYQCKASYREYSDLAKANVYTRTIYCRQDGFWTYQLPECEPVCGVSTDGTVTPTIVDGKETKLGAFPWHAGLYKRDNNDWKCICGGSLITNRIVLTAAHCVFMMKEDDLRIGLGKKYRTWSRDEPTAVKRAVSRIEVPKEYRGSTATYTWDIALLLLSARVEFNSFVLPVCRDTNLEFDIARNYTGYVVGWGRTRADGSESEVLLHNDLILLNNGICSRRMPSFLSFDKLCGVKPSSGVSIAEKGDSGGGVTAVFNNLHYIFGIVSVKYNNISVFTNVSWDTHKRWVDYEIAHLSTFVN